MIEFGYIAYEEEHGPAALVKNAIAAEEAGFDFVSISDHFSTLGSNSRAIPPLRGASLAPSPTQPQESAPPPA